MSAPLAVGMVCYQSLGGSGVIAAELAVGLAERGHRVHLIAGSRSTRPLPECDRLVFHEVSASDYPLFDQPPYALAIASAIVEVSEDHHLDVIHVHYAVPHSASAYLARQVLGARAPRIITTLHGTDVTRVGVDPSYRSITRFTVAASDGVTVPSAYLRAEAYHLLGLPPGLPVEVIPNFVDTERFQPALPGERPRLEEAFEGEGGDGPTLFHVSNFRPVKRVLDVVEVLARVRRHVPARLVLVGDGPERAHVAQRARELGVYASTAFLGKRTDFAEHLRHADAFLLPSESESFGVAALEALACGVPAFGYRVGGLPEVVTPDAGALVEPFDVDALAAAVLEVVTRPALRLELGRGGRRRALELFQSGPAIERYESYYRRVLAQSPRAEV